MAQERRKFVDVLRDAKALTKRQRERLVDALKADENPPPEPPSDEEIKRRVDSIRDGTAKYVTREEWDESARTIIDRIRRERRAR